MSDMQTLRAELRERAGKGAARAVRRTGRVPAVIYGDKQPPVLVSIGFDALIREINRGGFMHRLFLIEVDGQQIRVVPRDLQLDVVKDLPIHIDFLRLRQGARVDVEVPIAVLNEDKSPGLRRGGVLNIVRHEIEISAPAEAIPDVIEVDVSGLDINESVHIIAMRLPEGVEPTVTDRDFTILTIAAPTVMTEEAGAEPETPETEVMRGGDKGEE
jgi:large subunit ribosomal protein L25